MWRSGETEVTVVGQVMKVAITISSITKCITYSLYAECHYEIHAKKPISLRSIHSSVHLPLGPHEEPKSHYHPFTCHAGLEGGRNSHQYYVSHEDRQSNGIGREFHFKNQTGLKPPLHT